MKTVAVLMRQVDLIHGWGVGPIGPRFVVVYFIFKCMLTDLIWRALNGLN